jgi:hypothetical protein
MAFEWTGPFLLQLASSPDVSAAAAVAGVSRTMAYKHRDADPEFAAAWQDALDASTDGLAGEAYRRARHGTEKAVYYRGEECGRVREYSDTLAIFLLKAHRPEVYGAKVDVTSGGKPVPILTVQVVRPDGVDDEG